MILGHHRNVDRDLPEYLTHCLSQGYKVIELLLLFKKCMKNQLNSVREKRKI